MARDAFQLSLVRTLAWFDLLKHPLTAFECWYYLYAETTLPVVTPFDVQQALQKLVSQGVVSQANGFWQLADSPPWLTVRQQRARWAIAKRHRAIKGAKLLRHLPFVKMVAVGNTVAFETANQNSDIDLFIVVAPRRLMLVRLLVTAVLQLRGWRRHRSHVADRLCLSFFVTTAALNLKPLAYADDPYLTYWVAGLVPLIGTDTYRDWLQANQWVAAALPNWGRVVDSTMPSALVPTHPTIGRSFLEWLWGGRLGQALERMVGLLQLPHLRHYWESYHPHGSAVVVTNDVLKLHTNDRRQEFAREWRERLACVPGGVV